MRKLCEAAVVAVVVGGVSILGVGAASSQVGQATVNCDQNADKSTVTTQLAGDEIELISTGDGGNADASATQQICGVGNEGNDNDAGDATGGDGLATIVE
jgi:hypothetical protein